MGGMQYKTRYGFGSARLVAAACLGCLLVLLSSVARAEERGEEGFVPLLNGKDLSGWQTRGQWVYEADGALAARPRGRRRLFPDPGLYLWSKATYDDFVLDLEFRVGKNASSGVFLRSTSRRSYIQVQIRDDYGKPEPLGNHDCGAVVGVAAPSKNMEKPAGEWNRMIITCDGDRMRVQLNGEQIIDLDLSKSEKTRGVKSGRIALENTNSPVAFRNVRIKELKRE
jgi:hypothetical protein